MKNTAASVRQRLLNLSRQFDFRSGPLREAISATFEKRGTAVPHPPLFSDQFAVDKQPQWLAFIRRLKQKHIEKQFSKVLAALDAFLGGAIESPDNAGNHFWPAGGPWRLENKEKEH